MLKYAGIGSRETPSDVLAIMGSIAKSLTEEGWLCRSGGAKGADTAFIDEALPDQREVYLPWTGYNKLNVGPGIIVPKPTPLVEAIAAAHHDAWFKTRPDGSPVLTDQVKLFMCRNVTIIAGQNLDDRVQMAICWTPNGEVVGGTGHALRVCESFGVRVFNLAKPEDWDPMCEYAEFLTRESRK